MAADFSFMELSGADLIVDAIYRSDSQSKSFAGEPLAPLTGTGNQGGFRFSGPTMSPNLVVLYSTQNEPDWPDSLDHENGLFYYFGDNRKPGYELHDKRAGRGGNQILREAFARAHGSPEDRASVPPFLLFSKAGPRRDVAFRGLAVPGAVHLDQSSDLVALWKTVGGQRFQNYRAVFTVLDVARVPRSWITELQTGIKLGGACPANWLRWVETGRAKALRAPRVSRTRNRADQLGRTPLLRAIAGSVYDHFKKDPIAFEHFAAAVVRMMDGNVTDLDVTRPSRDGGRDGIGKYRIGQLQNCVTVDFAVEAKCHSPDQGLGVKVVARLISRLRHRQFGVLVTTSFLAEQAYSEIIEDEHPIIVCSGGDIADLLVEKAGLNSVEAARAWLIAAYPV